MRVKNAIGIATFLALALAVPAWGQAPPSVGSDDQVSGGHWVRHDGGTDRAIAECNDPSTNPALDDNPSDGDNDSNDGGSRHYQDEPFAAIDPTDPDTIVVGFNNLCPSDLTAPSAADHPGETQSCVDFTKCTEWLGLGFSRNGGDTWTNSLVPGYPQDSSATGSASPVLGHQLSSDPVGAFDSDGNLFVGGIAFGAARGADGDLFVASYGAQDGPNGYPVSYRRTVVVGQGTPAPFGTGPFNDKPSLEVDRTGGPHDGNVYACWTRFVGQGAFRAFFSRSTDSGKTFSKPIGISVSPEVIAVQGCDIAVEHDGDVYVTYRVFGAPNPHVVNSVGFVRSSNGGRSFDTPVVIPTTRGFRSYRPTDVDVSDSLGGCGDGSEHCRSDFVFHRVSTNPRVTADQLGGLPGLYLVYNALDPATIVPSASSYSSGGPGFVGQSRVYLVRSLDDGRTWSSLAPVDPQLAGHQFFADVDALDGRLGVVWEDSRADPAYSVQFPMGNKRDAQGRAVSSGDQVVNTFFAYSFDGVSFSSAKVSDAGQQTEREGTTTPFHGDYNWIAMAKQAGGGVLAYMPWTDTRDMVKGTDASESFDDGFDVELCWAQQPDGSFQVGCRNSGGDDANIYGNSAVFPAGP